MLTGADESWSLEYPKGTTLGKVALEYAFAIASLVMKHDPKPC